MVLEKRRGGTVSIFSSKRVGYYNHIQILSHDPQTNPLTADENCESFDIPSISNLRCVSVLFVVVLGHPNGVEATAPTKIFRISKIRRSCWVDWGVPFSGVGSEDCSSPLCGDSPQPVTPELRAPGARTLGL